MWPLGTWTTMFFHCFFLTFSNWNRIHQNHQIIRWGQSANACELRTWPFDLWQFPILAKLALFASDMQGLITCQPSKLVACWPRERILILLMDPRIFTCQPRWNISRVEPPFDPQIAAANWPGEGVWASDFNRPQKLVLDASKANSLQERPAFFE